MSLAVTAHDNYDAVLAACHASRLSQVCPKDVRARLPKALEASAYNILLPPKSTSSSKSKRGWRIANYRTMPSPYRDIDTFYYKTIDSGVERLAYMRRVAWLKPEEIPLEFDGFAKAYEAARDLYLLTTFRIPVPTEECKAYMLECIKYAKGVTDECVNFAEKHVWRFMVLDSRKEVESVEYHDSEGLVEGLDWHTEGRGLRIVWAAQSFRSVEEICQS